jgi:putative membrane protein
MKLYSRMYICAMLAALLGLSIAGCQRSSDNVQAARETSALTDADRHFLDKAEQDNLQERELGRMVVQKTQNSDVRDYGQMLVDDHTKALKDLVDLMKDKGMAQPKGLPKVEHEAMAKLKGMSGAEFDREFVNMMVRDHQDAVKEFQHESNLAQDYDVKMYANHVLPVLQKHLQKAQELQGKISGGPNTR